VVHRKQTEAQDAVNDRLGISVAFDTAGTVSGAGHFLMLAIASIIIHYPEPETTISKIEIYAGANPRFQESSAGFCRVPFCARPIHAEQSSLKYKAADDSLVSFT
jgi:hypothetical protein